MAITVVVAWVTAASMPVLTLDSALQAAREHHPQLRQVHAQTAFAREVTHYAFSQMLPQINGNAQYSRTTANFALSPGALPPAYAAVASESQGESYNFFSLGLTASQLLYDFGQAYYTMRSNDATADAAELTEAYTVTQVLYTVRTAYFNARAKRGLLAVARDTVSNQAKHRAQVEAFVDAGRRPAIDLMQARADYSSSQLAAINAAGDYEVAKAQLNQAMGVERDLAYDIDDQTMPAVANEDAPLDEQYKGALESRSDYRAAHATLTAQELILRSSQGAFGPTVGFSAGVTDAGQSLTTLVWNWKVGVNLSWAIFGDGETYFTVEGNRANAAAAAANQLGVQQQVRLDVHKAHLAVGAAKQALSAADDGLANARKLLELAEARYSVGLSTMIELGDAQVALSTAANQQVQAEFAVASARASLLRSMGTAN